MMEWTAFEDQARAEGYTCICGIDEAGRGPLAGPVYAAAVVLRPGQVIEGVNDSKKLSKKSGRPCLTPFAASAPPMGSALPQKKKLMKSIFSTPLTLPCSGR